MSSLPAVTTYANAAKTLQESSFRLGYFTAHTRYLPVRYIGAEGKPVDVYGLGRDKRPRIADTHIEADLATVASGTMSMVAPIMAAFAFGPVGFFAAAAAGVRCTSLFYKWAMFRGDRCHSLGAPPKIFKKIEAKLDNTTPFGKAMGAVLAQTWLDELGKADIRGVALHDHLSAIANNPEVGTADRDSAKRFIAIMQLTTGEWGVPKPLDEEMARTLIAAMAEIPDAERPAIGALLADQLMKKRPKKFDFALWQQLEKTLVG